ncbi:MAG: Cation transporting ATPase, E1-E2 family [Candidatus Saccharibacteria bacterium GW2011_GWA2_46_10]|nr:MAG: Cation transporting ATPase, E1-E2 family [Candidatus Saccharibacteria bacterium GW2011_GWA2_46_10]
MKTMNHNQPIYTCPMHPEVIQDGPGSCPKCGMSLVPQAKKPDVERPSAEAKKDEHAEHDKHAGHSVAMFRDRFWLSLVLTIPVLAYSETIQQWLNFSPPVFSGSRYIPFVLSTVQFGLSGEAFFWELATLITIMLLGHWLEMASIKKAQSALDAIAKLLPDKAEKLVNGQPQAILVSELKVGDLVLVRPGAAMPVDGVVTEGTSSVNEAAITGESKPVSKSVNSEVIAGTINQDGSLTLKVTKLGEDTALAGIMRLVAEAAASKSNVQVLADKAAYVLTIVAIAVGLATFLIWLLTKDSGFALERSVTVLIIACPHALGLAIPLVVSISTSLSASNGLLVRKRLALESARQLDWVLFDKTGTLTRGEHGVTDIWPAKGYTEEDILHLTASLEQNSEHIVGKGIVKEARDKHVHLDKVEEFAALPGLGVKGKLHGKDNFVAASYRYISEHKLALPAEIQQHSKKAAQEGKTEVYLIKDGKQVIGAIALADIIRDESKAAIAALRKMGYKTAMITGDSQDVADYVAKQLNLDQYFAEVKPQDKSAKVKQLQAGGQKVAMVGDGINDAPALTQADIGLAIGGGTDVAIKSADIILVKNDPRDVVKVIKLSKATYGKMKQNLAWATGYNVVAIPLAAGVLYKAGILLAPALAAVFMSLSTIIVALNAQLLRRLQLN